MEIKTGKRAGKSGEELVLKDPAFVEWFLENSSASRMSPELERLIKLFDAKPFTVGCHSCGAPATRASVYRQTPDCMFWCETCDHYNAGADRGKLAIIRTYKGALAHINNTANGYKAFKPLIIKQMAQAKGLPDRVGRKQAEAFFA